MSKSVVAAILVVLVAVWTGFYSWDDPQSYLINSYATPPSWPRFYAVHGAALFFQMLSNYLKPPPMKLVEDVHYFMVSRIVYAVTELNIATLLGEKTLSVEELAIQTNVAAPDHLQRLMQTAQSLGYFQEDRHGYWRNNLMSSLLRDQHPAQLKYMVQSTAGYMYSFWEEIVFAMRETTPYNRQELNQKLFQRPGDDAFWSLLSTLPQQQYLFQKNMVAMDSVSLLSTVIDYDWSRFTRVIDIGAQEGSFMKQLFQSYPSTLQKGVLFDLPHVIENAKQAWRAWPERHHVDFVGGDFFNVDTLPIAHSQDAFVMRNILHDWSDPRCLEILTNLRTVMGTTESTLVIIELVPDKTDPLVGARLIDIHMLLMFGGKERSIDNWKVLFTQTGFEFVRIQQTRSPLRIVEARPV